MSDLSTKQQEALFNLFLWVKHFGTSDDCAKAALWADRIFRNKESTILCWSTATLTEEHGNADFFGEPVFWFGQEPPSDDE